MCSVKPFMILSLVEELRDVHLLFCLVRNTADIREASPAFRMMVSAVACPLLLLTQYPLHDRGSAVVFNDIPDDIFFSVPKTVTDKVLFHSIPSICLPLLIPARLLHNRKNRYAGGTPCRSCREIPESVSW